MSGAWLFQVIFNSIVLLVAAVGTISWSLPFFQLAQSFIINLDISVNDVIFFIYYIISMFLLIQGHSTTRERYVDIWGKLVIQYYVQITIVHSEDEGGV